MYINSLKRFHLSIFSDILANLRIINILYMDTKKNRDVWNEISHKISQGRCEDPNSQSAKALSHVKTITSDAFIPRTPIAESDQTSKCLTTWVFHPEAISRIMWDILLMLFILYQSINVPFRICFNVESSGPWAIFEFIMGLCFIFDLCNS